MTDIPAILEESAEGRLKRRTDLLVNYWTFWEHKTLNVHRGVALFAPPLPPSSLEDLNKTVRTVIPKTFRRSWWRGFGFGLILDLRDFSFNPDTLSQLVDGRENRLGVWQWTIALCKNEKLAFGIHMWIEGYLSPVYRSMLRHLEEDGFQTASLKVEKDGVMKVLTAVVEFNRLIRSFGRSSPVLKEFDNLKK